VYDNWPCDVRAPSFVAEPLLGDGSIYTDDHHLISRLM
jgi:hypothetical protein